MILAGPLSLHSSRYGSAKGKMFDTNPKEENTDLFNQFALVTADLYDILFST